MDGELTLISTRRIDYIDMAKGIGILLIIFGHLQPKYGVLSNYASYFKISLFYVLSGFLVSKSDKVNVKGKTKSLLVPYFFWSLIFIVEQVIKGILRGGDVKDTILYIIEIISGKGIMTLWFLPSLLLAIILHIYITPKNTFFIVLLLIIVPFFVKIIIATDFVVNIKREISITYILFCFLCVAVKGIVAWWFFETSFLTFSIMIERIKIYQSIVIFLLVGVGVTILPKANIDFNRLFLGDYPILFFAVGLVASFSMIISLKGINSVKVLCYIGRNSLFFMCAHMVLFITSISNKMVIAIQSKIFNTKINNLASVSSSFLITVTIVYLLSLVWNHIKDRVVLKYEIFKYI